MHDCGLGAGRENDPGRRRGARGESEADRGEVQEGGAGRATEAAAEGATLEAAVAARGVELDRMREEWKATALGRLVEARVKARKSGYRSGTGVSQEVCGCPQRCGVLRLGQEETERTMLRSRTLSLLHGRPDSCT